MKFQRSSSFFVSSFVCGGLLFPLLTSSAADVETPNYGVDISFPMHHHNVSQNYAWLPHNIDPDNNPVPKEFENVPVQILGNKQKFYDDFMQGCRDHYKGKKGYCTGSENARIAMGLRQPQSMRNYTDTGFKKIRTPDALFQTILKFWENNKDNKRVEKWPSGDTHTNWWASPTYMASVEEPDMRGGGKHLKQKIWNAARGIIAEWTGEELAQTSLYGVRVYTEGAVLAPHVDRNPLVSSAIINVAQDVDEDWPLEVIGRDGRAYNVSMVPGDMVLYESHSLIHGRPFPLKGRYYANVFIHFHPIGSAEETHRDIPPYIMEGSVDGDRYKRGHTKGWDRPDISAISQPFGNEAALVGDLDSLMELVETEPEALHLKDSNGWEPIHEAARAGHKDIVEFLVKQGANINERTRHGRGDTPLTLAYLKHSRDHPFVSFLESLGAVKTEEL